MKISLLKTVELPTHTFCFTVGSFVVSHLKNIAESSSPRLQSIRELIKDERIPFDRFPQDIRKYSRNFEVSRYIDRLGLGGVFESDLIYDRSFAPRSFKVNMTLPIQKEEINVLEVGFRQVGLDHQIRKLVGPEGLLNGDNFPEVISEIMEFWMQEEDYSSNEVRRGSPRLPRATHHQRQATRSRIIEKLQSDDSVEGSLYITLAGKTIAYLDVADFSNSDNDMTQIIKSWKEMIKKSDLETDRAFSFMFLNKKYDAASVNGTVVLGLKTDRTGIFPSIAVEMSTRTPGKKLVQRLASSPSIKFERQEKKITFSLPHDRQNLFSIASEVFEVDAQGVEKLQDQETEREEKCSTSFNKYLGFEVCSKTGSPRKAFEHGIPLLNGVYNWDLEVVKTDRSMKGWEWTLELPEGRRTTFRAAFDTPQSSINRRVSLEAEVMNYRGLRVHLESPRKTVEVKTSYELDTTEVNYKIEALVDKAHKYSFESGIKRTIAGKKTEYLPVFRVSAPYMKPIAVSGNIMTERGRKAAIKFDLKSENNSQRFLRGNLVREGSLSVNKDFRLASDVTAELGFLSCRVFGAAEKKDTAVSSDLKIEYQTPNSRKHNVKLVGKLQNLSTAAQSKVNSFIEVQSSQFPSKNFHVSWNIVHKNDQLIENEVTIMWDGLMRDPTKKIHILQMSKFSGFKSGRTLTSDNIISFEVAPIDFNYDFKVSGHMERSKQTPKYKVQFEVNNKKIKDQDYQATFEYQHISAEPLKMAIDASLILPSGEIKYSDKIEEIAAKVYKGKTQLQWHQERKATLDYTLKVRNDANKIDLELDSELKTPSMTFGLHHQGLLRVSKNQFELESKMNHERNNIYELKADLNKRSRSSIQLMTRKFASKMEVDQSSQAKTALLEVTGQDWTHNSNFLLSNDRVTLSSKTLSQQQPVLIINARKSKRDSTRFQLESSLLDAKFDLNTRVSPKTASFEIKQKVGEQVTLKGKTTVRSSYDVEVSFEGKSASWTPRSVDMKLKKEGKAALIEVLSKENNREWITSRASYTLREKFEYEIHVSNRGIEVIMAHGKFDRRPVQGPHDVQIRVLRNGAKHDFALKHESNDRVIKTSASHSKDGQLQRNAEVNLRGNKLSIHDMDVDADLKVKNLRKSLDAHITHQHTLRRQGVETLCNGKFIMNGEETYEVKINSKAEGKETGEAHLRVEVKTPNKNWESQIGEIDASWEAETVKGQLRIQDHQQKYLILSAEASKKDKYQIIADIKSDFEKIPSASLEGSLDKKTLILISKVQNKEILKVEGSADFNNKYNFIGRLEGKASVTPRYIVSVESKKLGKQINYELNASQDDQKLLSLQASHEEQRDLFRHTLQVSLSKKNFKADVVSTVNKNYALGPHDWTVNVVLPQSGKKTLRVHHELVDGNINEWAKYLVQEQEKTSFSASGKYKRERSVFSIELMTRAKCPAFSSIEHEGVLRFGKGSAEVRSKLTLEDKKIYNANALVSRRQQSRFQLDSDVFRGKLEVAPFDDEKSAVCEFTSQGYEHSTDARINKRDIIFKSKTLKESQELVNVDVRASPKKTDASVQSVVFNTQVKYDVEFTPKTASFSFESKKGNKFQVKGKTVIKSVFDIDVQLEGKTSRSPLRTLNLKFKQENRSAFADIFSQEDNREYMTARASYDHSDKTLNYRVAVSKKGEEVTKVDAKLDRKVMQGPHDIEVTFRKNGQQQTLKMHHMIENREVKTTLYHTIDGRQQGLAEVRARLVKNNHGLEIDSEITLKCEKKYRGINEIQGTFKHQHEIRKNFVNVDTLLKGSLNEDRTVKFTLTSKHDSANQLKMKIDAALLLPNRREIRYSDELNEFSPRVFTGKTRVQWNQDKEATVDYVLKIKDDKNKYMDWEHECQVKLPSLTYPSRHEGHIRVSKDQLDVASKFTHEQNDLWNLRADLNRKTRSVASLEAKNFNGKIEADVSSAAKTATFDVSCQDWKHKTDFVVAADAFTLNSKTLDGKRSLVSLEVRKSTRDSHRFNLESSPVNVKFEVNSRSSPKTASFEVKQKRDEKVHIKGSAVVRSVFDVEFSLEGKSASQPQRSVEFSYKSHEESFVFAETEIKTQLNGQPWINSRCEVKMDNKLNFKVESSVKGAEKIRVDAKFDRKALEGPHDLEVHWTFDNKHRVVVHHEILNRNIRSTATHFKNDNVERSAEIFLNGDKLSVEETVINANLKMKCPQHSADIEVSHSHKWRRNSMEITHSCKAVMNGRDNYEVVIQSQADKKLQGKATLFVEVKTPLKRFERQTGECKTEWSQNQIKINVRVEDAEKKTLVVNGDISQQDKYRINGDIKSTFKHIPSASLEGSLDETSLFIVSKLRNKEVLKVDGSADYKMSSNLKQFRGKLEGKSSVTPAFIVDVEAKKIGHEITYNVEVTQDQQKVAFARASHERQGSAYVNKVQVSLDKNIELSLDASINKNVIQGPHDIEINAEMPQTPKRSIRIHHEVLDGMIKEHAKYLVDGQEKSSIVATGNYKQSRGAYTLESKMMHKNRKVYAANALLSQREKSFFNIESDVIRGKVEVTPFGVEKIAILEFQTRGYKHETEARIGNRNASLMSKTTKGSQQIAFVDAKGNVSAVEAEIDSPFFDSRMKYDVSPSAPRHASIDFKSKVGKRFQFNREYAM